MQEGVIVFINVGDEGRRKEVFNREGSGVR
jgi:hypothetical protein